MSNRQNPNKSKQLPPTTDPSTDDAAWTSSDTGKSPKKRARPARRRKQAKLPSKMEAPQKRTEDLSALDGSEDVDWEDEEEEVKIQTKKKLAIRSKPTSPSHKVESTAKKGERDDEVEKSEGLSLRIEMNLDMELELKGKINGDVTLAIF